MLKIQYEFYKYIILLLLELKLTYKSFVLFNSKHSGIVKYVKIVIEILSNLKLFVIIRIGTKKIYFTNLNNSQKDLQYC